MRRTAVALARPTVGAAWPGIAGAHASYAEDFAAADASFAGLVHSAEP